VALLDDSSHGLVGPRDRPPCRQRPSVRRRVRAAV